MTTAYWKRWTVLAGILCACGCSKFTYEHWQTIQVGSATPEAVQATLGDPWKKADGTWVYNDPDQNATAMIKFKDNKVVGKEWADAKRGMETLGEQPTKPGDGENLHIQTIK